MSNETALTIVRQEVGGGRVALLEPNNLKELQDLGALMAASGFFQDAKAASQACVKILAGREMGFPPIASMVGISIIDGKPATGATLLAAAMKRHGYTWKVIQRDAKGCRIVVSFKGGEIGPSEFLEEDAKRANLLNKQNWQKYPRAMYFARAISDAARTYAPEILAGLPAYTAEELGAEDTTEDGTLISREVKETTNDVVTRRIAEEQTKANAQAEERATAEAKASPVSGPNAGPRPWTTFRGMLERFDDAKERVGETIYYATLGRHGTKHANQFKSGDIAHACYLDLQAEEAKLGAMPPTNPTQQATAPAVTETQPSGGTTSGAPDGPADTSSDIARVNALWTRMSAPGSKSEQAERLKDVLAELRSDFVEMVGADQAATEYNTLVQLFGDPLKKTIFAKRFILEAVKRVLQIHAEQAAASGTEPGELFAHKETKYAD